ncbi:MAG TPA: energy transducer TonB [Burkholderiaceae bacterium]
MLDRDRLGSVSAVFAAHVVFALALIHAMHKPATEQPTPDLVVKLEREIERPVASPLIRTPEIKRMAPVEPALPVMPSISEDNTVPVIQTNGAPPKQAVEPAHTEVAKQVPASEDDAGPSAEASAAGNAKPAYPKISRALGEQGCVLLDVYVEMDGTVGEIRLHQSSGFDRLDQSALRAVRQWRFKPARQGGKQVATWYVQPITFNLQNA